LIEPRNDVLVEGDGDFYGGHRKLLV
jgi:hypothetical protein